MGILLKKLVNGYLMTKGRRKTSLFLYLCYNHKCKEKVKFMKSFVKMILQILYRMDYICLYMFYRMKYKINDNQVLFLSDSEKI